MASRTIVLRDEAGREYRVGVDGDGGAIVGEQRLQVDATPDGSVRVSGTTTEMTWAVAVDGTLWVFADGRVFTFEVEPASGRRRRTTVHHGTLTAPMPATVRKLLVGVGDEVRRHETLIVLEAMKMELPIRAPANGRVEKVHCREGELVQPGVSLIDIEDDD